MHVAVESEPRVELGVYAHGGWEDWLVRDLAFDHRWRCEQPFGAGDLRRLWDETHYKAQTLGDIGG